MGTPDKSTITSRRQDPRHEDAGTDAAVPWHARPAADALAALGSGEGGLDWAEATARLGVHGPNRVDAAPRRGILARFLAQFHNVLIYVLLASAGIAALLGHWVDTGVILGVVAINALVGVVQEGKAERALDAIRVMLSPTAVVVRDGRRATVPAETLVPGDIVDLKSGDRVPADLRLLAARGLRVQEAALTGESEAVDKSPAPVPPGAPLAERSSMAHGGTFVTHGRGRGVAVATGAASELGRIGALVAGVSPLETPLLRQTRRFARWLTVGIVLLAGGTFSVGYWLAGYGAGEMFMAAVGLAVAAIPEGLPAVMTITFAIGVTRMAGRNAIIRRLPAVETLGSVTVICTDKTGTLTRNEMAVQAIVTANRDYTVSGEGYGPEGEILLDGAPVVPEDHPGLVAAVLAASRCNDAELIEHDGAWRLHGDPTEGALLALALKAGRDPSFDARACPRVDLIPFESEHKFMATLRRDHEGHGHIYVKGAPERILDMCAWQGEGTLHCALDRAYWRARADALAGAGMRVLTVAYRRAADGQAGLTFEDMSGGFCLLGLFGLIDPPRATAVAAIAQCKAAGIRVKMITGDHAATAHAIGRLMGIGNEEAVVTGAELDAADDAELARLARAADIFARTTPEHKLRLVQALQTAGEVVAMSGDGVNDAPALKRADVGVAMGRRGTEAAKAAAEVVLADDNFASIAHAVEEGRTVYDNLKKAVLFILPTSGGEALTIMAAIALGYTLPITPVQILWVNMVTAVTLGLALAFEPAEADVMARRPRRPDEPILTGFLVWRVVFVSALLVAGVFGLFLLAGPAADIEAARTVAVNALVAGEIVYLVNSRRMRGPAWTLDGLFGSRPVLLAIAAVVLFQALFTYLPVLQGLFGAAPIGWAAWGRVAAFALVLFTLVEAEKAVTRRAAR